MEREFTKWFKSNEKRFAHGQFNEKQVAYSAWLEGQKQALRIHDAVERSEPLPPTCVMDMPDSKYCDCSNECKWCENISR